MSDDPTSDEARAAFDKWWNDDSLGGQARRAHIREIEAFGAFLAGRASATPKPGEAMELRAALAKAREATIPYGAAGHIFEAWSELTRAVDEAEAALVAAEREREAMREALKFYRDQWTVPPIGPRERPEPNLRLCNDQGELARRALTKEPNG